MMRQADPDLWGHILFGKIFWERGFFYKDIYSYTASGRLWVDHEWLWEVIFARAYIWFGFSGVYWLKVVVVLVIAKALYALAGLECCSPARQLVLFAAVTLTVGHFSLMRPQIFTYLFMSWLFLFFLREKYLLCLILFPLWANTHGGFIAGLLTFLLLLIWRILVKEICWKKALVLLGTAAGLTLLNPYGLLLHRTVLHAILNPLTRQAIVEWKAAGLFHPFLFPLMALFTVVFLLSRRQKDFRYLMLLMALVMALASTRHIPLFAIYLAALLPCRQVGFKVSAGIKLLFYLFLFLLNVLALPSGFSLTYPEGGYPDKALAKIGSLFRQGKLCTPFGWGEFAIFRLYPNWKVCIDGRYDTVYSLSTIKENFDLFGGFSHHRYPMLEEADCVVSPPWKPVVEALRGKWHVVFEDKTEVALCKPQLQKLLFADR